MELNIRLTINQIERRFTHIHTRILSRWCDCITTEVVSENSEQWIYERDESEDQTDEQPEQEIHPTECEEPKPDIATWSRQINPKLSGHNELLEFNRAPGLFAILMGYIGTKRHMISFTYLDCSALLLQGGSVSSRASYHDGIMMDVQLSSPEQLVATATTIPLEPLVLSLDSFDAFPTYDDVDLGEDLKDAYIYGCLDFGGVQRKILAYPQGDRAVSKGPVNYFNSAGDLEDARVPQASVPIGFRSCVLAGEVDVLKFKESLTSSTFTLQIHTDDICSRVFSEKRLTEYNKEFSPVAEPSPRPLSATSKTVSPEGSKNGTPRKKDKGGKASAPLPDETMTFPTDQEPNVLGTLDEMILGWITEELNASEKIKSHGNIRFRLEHLLECATDALMEFEKTRTGRDNSKLNVVISEKYNAIVRPTRPSQPPRWHMPSDISLKSALEKSKAERAAMAVSGQFGTSTKATTGTLTLSGTTRKGGQRRPLYELYKDCDTVLNMTAELHRKYRHPENTVSVAPPKRGTDMSLSSTTPPLPPTPKSPGGSIRATTPKRQSDETALDKRLRITPFARMVFVFKYDDNDTLSMINEAMASVNSRALPDIQGTLRSYSFSKEDIKATNEGHLDVVCGFSVIDDDTRLIVLEGLGGIGLGMQNIFADIPRRKENDNSLKILCNPEVLFPKRLYTEFGPDLKRVRPREKLRKLAKKPEIYNRKQVDIECFEAIDKLMQLKRCSDLKTTKELDCYPTAECINQLELLYGDALSKQDLDGALTTIVPTDSNHVVTFSDLNSSQMLEEGSSLLSAAEFSARGSSSMHRGKESRLAPTDCHNPVFDDLLRNRDPSKPRHDRLQEQREIRKAAWAQALNRLAAREAEDDAIIARVLGIEDGRGVKIHCYSGQSKNFTEMMAAERRKQLAATKGATFTYSQEYLSQNILLVDEEADKKANKIVERSKWTTQRGFQYPPPKNIKELLQHPKRPHEARIEDLKEPYESFTNENIEEDPVLRQRERDFVVESVDSSTFGMLEPPQFSREFELSLVGDRKKLPRGMLVGGTQQNEKFWQSVHLSGDKSAKAQQEAAEAEERSWKDKVVVDHLDFKVGGFKVRDKPLQLDRTADILKGEPKDKALIKLRDMKSQSGKDISYKSTPLTIMNTGEYVPNAMEKSLLRGEDKTKFVTTQQTGEATDFTRYIHHGTGKPKQVTFIAKKKASPIQPFEKSGPKWERPSECGHTSLQGFECLSNLGSAIQEVFVAQYLSLI